MCTLRPQATQTSGPGPSRGGPLVFVGLLCWRDRQVAEPPTGGEKVCCWKGTVSGLAAWTAVRGPPGSQTRDGA